MYGLFWTAEYISKNTKKNSSRGEGARMDYGEIPGSASQAK